MDEYIKRKDAFEILQSRLDSISQMSYLNMDWYELDIMRNAIEDAIDDVGEVPAADVQPVSETENMAIISDEFICKRCSTHIKDYIKVVLDEDNDGYIDEQHYDYEPKFCPECGAKVKGD